LHQLLDNYDANLKLIQNIFQLKQSR